jgi:hypothetical protein
MTDQKSISPLVVGTFIAGLTMVNTANAAIITTGLAAGDSNNDTIQQNLSITVDDNNPNDYFGIDVDNNGEDDFLFSIHQFVTYGEGEDIIDTRYDLSVFPTLGGAISVSTYLCGENIQCLKKFNQGDTIDQDAFNGPIYNGERYGIFYIQNTQDSSTIGDWLPDDFGYVAFAYVMKNESGNLWDSPDVKYGWFDATRGSITVNTVTFQSSVSVPEPSTLLILGSGLLAFTTRNKRLKLKH